MPPPQIPPITRRQFLRRLGIATGVTLGLAPLHDLRALAQPARPVHVVILGAGLAGLCAGLELERRGHTCTILEAETTHIGGRARTLRFETGLYGEAGAMRVPKGHALPRHYISEFGLALSPFVQSNPEAFYFARGRRERIKDVGRLNSAYTLNDAEREKSPDDLWAGSLVKRLKALSPAERAELANLMPSSPGLRALDQQSLQQLFETEGLSPGAIEFLAVTYGMEALLGSALTEHLREEELGVWTQGFDEIVGGTDRLPAGFAARLKSKPRMGAEVVRLEQDPLRRRAAAIYRDKDNRLVRVEGDFILCTLPFPVVTRLEVEPAFSGTKQRAIRELNYDSSTKVLAVTRRRFWEQDDGIFGGGTYSDLPTATTWYPRPAIRRCRPLPPCSSPRTPGGRPRAASPPCPTRSGAPSPSPISPRCTRSSRAPARCAGRRAGAGTITAGAAAPSRGSCPASGALFTATWWRPRAASTSRGSTCRCLTRGCRARSSPPSSLCARSSAPNGVEGAGSGLAPRPPRSDRLGHPPRW